MSSYKKLALLFPGQGSQIVGMGKDLIQDFPYISKLYQEADRLLQFPISKVMFEGSAEELKQTENTQPALLLHSFSILKILEKELGFQTTTSTFNDADYSLSNSFTKKFDFYLGHSLGEYTALLASNRISFPDSINLVRKRGQLMKQCKQGVMYALLSKQNMLAENGAINEIKTFLNNDKTLMANISNINSPNQIVISGEEQSVLSVISMAKQKKLFSKVVKLEVSAAFHSQLMMDCSLEFKDTLDKVTLNDIKNNLVISNVTAQPHNNDNLRQLLEKQLVSTVCWVPSLQWCIDEWKNNNNSTIPNDDYCFIEIGSNTVLKDLFKQMNSPYKCINIGTSQDIKNFIKELKENGSPLLSTE
ncbi:hypothetical protein DLAC_04940 [Tieghemostelium lacteum]|uniref:[acyl-carrier-protein] S-malonyltransferase n=1 Tax=Tieghemostelium lacteum TaxID=361077 RepID=A0A151ZI46_TIELA|nr:hypothetical protein DLAC_04940 [Tieghemostelium lacteum]|eukprot:KYQ93569.1 hypothetical protein DLAC_04940 [Tieghemostelium lacteum]